MKYWERIRKERPDIADYVIHWVRRRYEGRMNKTLDTLIDIIECGYLKPSFATKSSIYDRSKRPTVRGPYPAVCFTEQTLEHFIKSCEILPGNYNPYGVALHKRAVYKYGGRPVIYGSEDLLGELVRPGEPGYEEGKEIYKNGLPKEYQYLWVRYDPIPNQDGYVVDWTHEREWRCRVHVYQDTQLGKAPEEGIPLLLPAVYDFKSNQYIHYLPKILVSKTDDKEAISEIIQVSLEEWSSKCEHNYLQSYFKALPKVKIIALEELAERPETVELEWLIPEKDN